MASLSAARIGTLTVNTSRLAPFYHARPAAAESDGSLTALGMFGVGLDSNASDESSGIASY